VVIPPHWFTNEDRVTYHSDGYVERTCVHCHKMFQIARDNTFTFDCGFQDQFHPVFVYQPKEPA